MASDLNRCEFIGRLGRDPEIRYSPSGDPVTSFSLAVGWKTKDKEGVEWVNIVAFGKLAEICGEYLKRGKQVYVSGRFNTQKYQDKETGADRYSTRIIADQLQMLGSREDGDGGSESRTSQGADRGSYGSQRGGQSQRPAPAQQQPSSGSSFADMDDDIPF